jgi:hypothetical protein
MNNLKKVKKYETALKVALFLIESNPTVNLTKLRKDLKINKNFITSLSKLEIIKNNANNGARNYVALKSYSKELALEVLNYSNKLSLNIKTPIVENEITVVKNKTLLQKIIEFFKL